MKKGFVTYEVTNPNITLLRLVMNHPNLFHKQDWYLDEEFANRVLEQGTYGFPMDGDPSAALLAYGWVTGYSSIQSRLKKYYIWTCDVDAEGHRIYVGCSGKQTGLQIHRHLANPKVKDFMNAGTTN